MNRLNEMLCRDTRPSEFVTLIYGVLDVPNKRFTYCNAGHPPALLLREGIVTELTGAGNMVLGIDPFEQFTQATLELRKGDALLFYTDGLADAVGFEKQRFGRGRIIDTFKSSSGDADTIAQNILWTVRKFVGMTKRNDDITMTVVKIV
jgi:sigma-B regulation protein RsbU (phosphoserine phosphatase)